jgi:hypothetical protein
VHRDAVWYLTLYVHHTQYVVLVSGKENNGIPTANKWHSRCRSKCASPHWGLFVSSAHFQKRESCRSNHTESCREIGLKLVAGGIWHGITRDFTNDTSMHWVKQLHNVARVEHGNPMASVYGFGSGPFRLDLKRIVGVEVYE